MKLYQIKQTFTISLMAGSPGFEPGKKASKASVIPFHHDPIITIQIARYYTQFITTSAS